MAVIVNLSPRGEIYIFVICGPLKACEYQTTESLFSKMFCFSDVWYSDLHCNSVFLEPFFFTKIENKFRHRG